MPERYYTHPLAERLWTRVAVTDDARSCWMCAGNAVGQYASLKDEASRKVFAHRLAWELADGHPVPLGLCVLHTCDVRTCVRNDERGIYVLDGVEHPRWGHLWLGTQADNMRDMALKRRGEHGDRHWTKRHFGGRPGLHKLAAEQAVLIRELSAGGARQADLATRFGVTPATVWKIVSRKTWRHLV